MKKFIRAACIVSAFLAAPAWAADMAVKAPPPPIAAPVWTGWYLGLNAGGFWGTSETTTTVAPVVGRGLSVAAQAIINAQGAPANIDTSGFVGGVHGGYNYQAARWLVGLEADIESFRNRGTRTSAVPGVTAGATFILNSSVSTDWLLTVRPRLGLVANNWLFYGTGGLAVTRIGGAWNWSNPGGIPPIAENASAASTKAGWTVGGGVETMLPGRWIVGAEYLYVKFTGVSATALAVDSLLGLTNPFNHSADLSSNIVRARLSKAF